MQSFKGSVATDTGVTVELENVDDLNGANDDEIVKILMKGAEDDAEAK